ncbi:MAG: metallophosphoesterase [Vulcanimicrobiota bacterium]
MIYGFLTDVHGDLEALRRALASLDGVDRIVFLGDVAGGPRVPECIELLRPHLAVCGNHDRWDFELMGLPELARQYLARLPVTLEEADFLAVHSDFERSGPRPERSEARLLQSPQPTGLRPAGRPLRDQPRRGPRVHGRLRHRG